MLNSFARAMSLAREMSFRPQNPQQSRAPEAVLPGSEIVFVESDDHIHKSGKEYASWLQSKFSVDQGKQPTDHILLGSLILATCPIVQSYVGTSNGPLIKRFYAAETGGSALLLTARSRWGLLST